MKGGWQFAVDCIVHDHSRSNQIGEKKVNSLLTGGDAIECMGIRVEELV